MSKLSDDDDDDGFGSIIQNDFLVKETILKYLFAKLMLYMSKTPFIDIQILKNRQDYLKRPATVTLFNQYYHLVSESFLMLKHSLLFPNIVMNCIS